MSDSDPHPGSAPPYSSSHRIHVSGRTVNVDGDIIGGDKYVGYTAKQINVLLKRIQAEYLPKPFNRRSPYLGLDVFQERDADKFFGRESPIANLVTRMNLRAASNARAVCIAGPAESGKTSLFRVGFAPAFKHGKVAGWQRRSYEILKPRRELFQELKRVDASFTKSVDAGIEFIERMLSDASRCING